jgi:hypothetical protein
VGKARRKEITRKTLIRLEGNIKIDLRVMGWVGMDWIDLAQKRDQCTLVNTVMNFRVP